MPSLIENPHFVTFLLSHRDLAPGFPPQKCCSSGVVYVVSSVDYGSLGLCVRL
ncbi:hypothetical protein JHK86_042289 [Glycine max]|nr:hypothetical protein JHK86_042289 [Glycine max]